MEECATGWLKPFHRLNEVAGFLQKRSEGLIPLIEKFRLARPQAYLRFCGEVHRTALGCSVDDVIHPPRPFVHLKTHGEREVAIPEEKKKKKGGSTEDGDLSMDM